MEPSTHAVSQYSNTSQKLAARLAIHDYSTNSQGWFPWLAERLPVAGDVLEVGAGTGQLWRHVDYSNARLVLTDFSAAMCAQLRDIPKAADADADSLTVKQCDAANLPFADSSFELVIANHMLYHLDDPDVALKGFARVLRPGGRLVVALNGRDHLQEILALGSSIGRPSTILNRARITAETAQAYLSRHFTDVTVEVAPGDFDVPKPEPLLAYLNSWDDGPLTPEQETSARQLIESKIAAEGTFRVCKHMMLFSAIRQ